MDKNITVDNYAKLRLIRNRQAKLKKRAQGLQRRTIGHHLVGKKCWLQSVATILRAKKPVGKTFQISNGKLEKIDSYPLIKMWLRNPVIIPKNIEDLSVLLQSILVNETITLSKPCGPVPLNKYCRRLTKDKETDKATLTGENFSTLFVLDIDHWFLAEPFDAFNPEKQLNEVRKQMQLGDYSCVWQLSSSAEHGSNNLKARFWFLIEYPMHLTLLKAAAGVLGADPAVFNPGQVIYTGPPIIKQGVDPIPNRWGTLGAKENGVPGALIRQIVSIIDTTAPKITSAQIVGQKKIKANQHAGVLANVPRRDINFLLSIMGDGDGLYGFHYVLMQYTMKAVKNKMVIDDIKNRCRGAINDAPKSPGRSQADIHRYLSDEYLNSIINGAVDVINSGDRRPPRHSAPAPVSSIHLFV